MKPISSPDITFVISGSRRDQQALETMRSKQGKNYIRDGIERKFDTMHTVADALNPCAGLDGVVHGVARGVSNWLLDKHPQEEDNACNPNNPAPRPKQTPKYKPGGNRTGNIKTGDNKTGKNNRGNTQNNGGIAVGNNTTARAGARRGGGDDDDDDDDDDEE
ncbi:uncharacterized protein LOC120111842 [Phoenix dactylifera]|uniref:Uncharacterized protein LOC120111842 n=1 Tax=Phoenix dactylifera TaxID=42345 RepID=A0A8B9AQU0_PHODC|nr:uncharacterized protein LOC120111842 [Phoenix dactylifera]